MRKLVSMLLILSMLLTLPTMSFADSSNGFAVYSEKTALPNDSTAYEDNKCPDNFNVGVVTNTNPGKFMDIIPYGSDPGEGAYQLFTTARYSSGMTYDIGPMESKSAFTLLNNVWTIGSSFVKTSQSVVLGVASVGYNELQGDIVVSSPSSAKVSKSYSNIYKKGQVYKNQVWKDYVTTHYQETFTHEYGSYASKSGYTRTKTIDRTGEYGYSPVNIEYTTHYHQNSWIQSNALSRYSTNGTPIEEYVVN